MSAILLEASGDGKAGGGASTRRHGGGGSVGRVLTEMAYLRRIVSLSSKVSECAIPWSTHSLISSDMMAKKEWYHRSSMVMIQISTIRMLLKQMI